YPRGRYLSQFLFKSHKGHCEFFATATALLLRAANISTRYVVGYAINEYSRLEGQYIGRASHAHSWVQAYVNGHWISVDTTPPVWLSQEQSDTSIITPLIDLWSWLTYKMALDDTDDDDENMVLMWFLLPVLLYYLWRIIFSKRSKLAARTPGGSEHTLIHGQGKDSAFYRLYQELAKIYGSRNRGQTLQQWLSGVSDEMHRSEIESLLQQHYRYRFDPAGLADQEVGDMNNRVDRILHSLQQRT
ncbi:MAG TPA: transglutaminase domain-containing protein, partial [Gammaproteobacteria bacterium]|nr:transglutaminase domain-containing protein [Gammaproteobacteria bacterium]